MLGVTAGQVLPAGPGLHLSQLGRGLGRRPLGGEGGQLEEERSKKKKRAPLVVFWDHISRCAKGMFFSSRSLSGRKIDVKFWPCDFSCGFSKM